MKIQLIDFGGRSPERAHDNDVGADVFSPENIVIRPGEISKIPLGFGLRIPDGFAGYIFPRSGLSTKGIVCEGRMRVVKCFRIHGNFAEMLCLNINKLEMLFRLAWHMILRLR